MDLVRNWVKQAMSGEKRQVEKADQDRRMMVQEISNASKWIHRRVESMQFLDSGATRRKISFDFSLPPVFHDLGFVPLAVFRKATLNGLDIKSSTGEALSNLNRIENNELCMRIMSSALECVDSEVTQELLYKIVELRHLDPWNFEAFSERRKLLDDYADLLSRDVEQVSFIELANLLMTGFILWVQVPSAAKPFSRTLIKVSYESEVPLEGKFFPEPVSTEIDPEWCSKFHFEVRAPLGLKIRELSITSEELIEVEVGDTEVPRDEFSSPIGWQFKLATFRDPEHSRGQVAHVVLDGGDGEKSWLAHYEMEASREGVVEAAEVASICVLALFALPILSSSLGFHILHMPREGTASALLLAGPAILVTYIARPSEHPIVAHRFFGARFSLLLSGGLLMSAAAVVGNVLGVGLFDEAWRLLGAISVGGMVYFQVWRNKATL